MVDISGRNIVQKSQSENLNPTAQENLEVSSGTSGPSGPSGAELGKVVRRSRKSHSFSHSLVTARLQEDKENQGEGNLIKITKMGSVTVPVPYPISACKDELATQWF